MELYARVVAGRLLAGCHHSKCRGQPRSDEPVRESTGAFLRPHASRPQASFSSPIAVRSASSYLMWKPQGLHLRPKRVGSRPQAAPWRRELSSALCIALLCSALVSLSLLFWEPVEARPGQSRCSPRERKFESQPCHWRFGVQEVSWRIAFCHVFGSDSARFSLSHRAKANRPASAGRAPFSFSRQQWLAAGLFPPALSTSKKRN